MENLKNEFINQCIKNRKYLGFSCRDMSLCLNGVSEADYIGFEEGKYPMSKENVHRLMKVLCIEKPNNTNYSEYIDTTGLTEEEIEDLSMIVEAIVGDENA